jgi:muconolactone delta-isomerase
MGMFLDDPAEERISAVGVEADKIAKIKAEIAEKNAELWLHGKDRRIVIGRLLIQLYDLLAKQGSGTFMKTVTGELHIPYTTATGYMDEAREADNVSCYEIGNNQPTEDDAEKPEAVGDAHAHAVEAAKAAEREKREEAKREGRFSTLYRVDFSPVSPEQRDRCKTRVRELGIAEAFTRFYNALFPIALSGTQGGPAIAPQPSVIQPPDSGSGRCA